MSSIVPFSAAFPALSLSNAKPLHRYGELLSFSKRGSGTNHRVLLNTIPKSGTYLLALILERLGITNTNVHLSDSAFWDFRGAKLNDIIRDPNQFRVLAPLDVPAGLLRRGQFAVGHVDYSSTNEATLKDFVQLFCIRDLRTVLVSHMRYILNQHCARGEAGPPWKVGAGPELFLHYLRGPGMRYAEVRILPMAGWMNLPDIRVVRFEAVVGDNGEEAQREIAKMIANRLGVPCRDPMGVIQRCIGRQTRTYTGRRSDYADFWSDEAEVIFRECGLAGMNADLGYA